MRMNNCPQCGKRPYYRSKYDRFCCLDCDIWTEEDHCVGTEDCDSGFLHSAGLKPSETEASSYDFQAEKR